MDADLQHVGGQPERLLADLDGCLANGVAAEDGGAARVRADAPPELLGVAEPHVDVGDVDAQLLGGDLGERRGVRLPLVRETGRDPHLAGARIDRDLGTLVRAAASRLDVARHAEPEPARAVLTRALLLGAERRHVDGVLEHLELREVVAAVDDDGEAVGRDEPVAAVRELVVADEVPPPHLERVDAGFARDVVEHALGDEARVRAARAAVRRAGDRVRVDAAELDLDVGNAVRPADLAGRDPAELEAVRHVRARVEEEVVAQPEHDAVARRRHLDVVDLEAFVVRGGEVLDAILDPLHRTPEPHRRQRHEHFLGVEEEALDAEAATGVGSDDPHAVLGHAEEPGEPPWRSGARPAWRPRASAAASRASYVATTPRVSIGIAALRSSA